MKEAIKQILKDTVRTAIIVSVFMLGAIMAPKLHRQFVRHVIGKRVVIMVDRNVTPQTEGYFGGTGFHVKAASGKTYIMSNRHVCESSRDGYMYLGGRKGDALRRIKIIEMNPKVDLCILEPLPGIEGLELSPEIANPGDSVWTIGYPQLQPKTVYNGEFVGYRPQQILVGIVGQQDFKESDCHWDNQQLVNSTKTPTKNTKKYCMETDDGMNTTVFIYGGASGSPMTDDLGRVVGVIFAGPPGGGWGVALTLTDVRTFLSRY